MIGSKKYLGILEIDSKYKSFLGLSVQPQNDHGEIFATCGCSGLLKIFDIRQSSTGQPIKIHILLFKKYLQSYKN